VWIIRVSKKFKFLFSPTLSYPLPVEGEELVKSLVEESSLKVSPMRGDLEGSLQRCGIIS